MLSILRHFSIRIWLTVMLGGIVSLMVLPMLQPRIGLEANFLMTAAILIFFFLATGWVLNRWALNNANYLMAEAGVFERDGMYPEADKAYRKAVAILDSFMVSPLVKRKNAGNLGARLARFYLAHSRRDQASEVFLVSYLNSNPQDEEVAEHWLHQIESGGGLKEEHQDLAARIGEAARGNNYIQSTLGRFYLLLERTDFPALQTYRRVCKMEDSATGGFIVDLARLFIKEGRSDEWALEIYLQALAKGGDRTRHLRGLAACLRWTPVTERNGPLLESARHHLREFDAKTLKMMRAGFHPPVTAPSPLKARSSFQPGKLLDGAAHSLYRYLAAIMRRAAASCGNFAALIQRSKTVRRTISGILLISLVSGIGILVANTIRHLTVKDTTADEVVTIAGGVTTDPFTLQVAAYLKPEYAKKYVRQLKNRGLDAYWSEAVRGQKKWYQVRISHFDTKQAARNFGEKLKTQGVIEDYYVANYIHQPPSSR